jgi:non-specific serine/threonine protein kinase
VELLGRLRAVRGEHVITRFRRQKGGVLLAYLAFHRERPHPRDELLEMLWPGCDPAAGRDRLSTLLVSLRHQLEPPGVAPQSVLLADRAVVGLNPDVVATDAATFQECIESAARAGNDLERWHCLSEAVGCYQGELLPGLCEEWVLRERARLAELYLQALGLLIHRWEAEGDLLRALDYARRAVAADPLREEGQRELIRLLLATGQPESARRQYKELERLLDRELDATPDPATRALFRIPPATLPSAPDRPTVIPSSPAVRLRGAATLTFLVAAADPTNGRDRWRQEIPTSGGEIVREGDGILAVAFASIRDAWATAAAIRLRSSAPGASTVSPLPRIAMHTGEGARQAVACGGAALDHAISLLRAAHPGQILASESSAVLLRGEAALIESGISLRDLGLYWLGDAATGARTPARLFQVSPSDAAHLEFPPLKAEPFRSAELPAPLTRFFGRQGEIADLCRRLLDPKTRLMSLTGPGGSGKTRLALAVAEELAKPLRGAVWFVPLAEITETQQAVDALWGSIRLPRTGARDPLATIAASLNRQPALLVLDNLEQMLEPAALLVRALLEQAPALTCLATSRQRLGLSGEQEFVVHPLPTPGVPESLEELVRYACVQLFVNRAQAVRPDFQVTRSNAVGIAELCRRLDGLPLAIELAAARASVLTPDQLLAQLAQPLEVLVDRRRDAVPRHRSLRAALEWSHRLLSPDLQRFFARLSVFRGGWTLEAAQAVCGSESALPTLEQLRECSLVSATESGPEMRFRILEPLREFAAEQLAPEERERAAERHAAYYLSLAEMAEPHLVQGDQGDWLELLEREHDNMRAALAWSVEASGGAASPASAARLETGLRLVAALSRFWGAHGYLAEGRDQLARLLAALEGYGSASPGRWDARLELYRARALVGASTLLLRHGDYENSRRLCEESLATARSQDDRSLMGTCYLRLGIIARDQGDIPVSRALLEEALALLQETERRQEGAWTLCFLGDLDREEGELERAGALYLAAEDLLRELGNRRDGAWICTRLGRLSQKQGDLESARRRFEEALGLFRGGRDPLGVAATLGLMGELALFRGEPDQAWNLGQEALRMHRELQNEHDCGGMLELLGRAALARRSGEVARAHFEEMLALARIRKNPAAVARAHAHLGTVAVRMGDRDTARNRFCECLSPRDEWRPNWGVAESLEGLAAIALEEGRARRAARLCAAAEAGREALRTPRTPFEQAMHDRTVEAARAHLGAAAWADAWSEGKRLTPPAAVEYALAREAPFHSE